MEKNIEYSKQIPILFETDILVVGGSQSGVAAAVCAKRANKNAKVTLIEQFGYLGGQSVGVMVCHYEFREYTNNKGQILAKGFGKELIQRTVAKGNSDPLYKDWLEGRGPPFSNVPDGRAFGDIPLDVEDLKMTMQEMCDEAGVEVLLFTKFVDVITTKDNSQFERPHLAIIANSMGLGAIKARIMIDCSANNDIVAKISPDHALHSTYNVMPMQSYAWFGGVDIETFINAIWEHRNWWLFTYPENKEQMLDHMRQGKSMVIRGGASYLDEADEKFPGILEAIEKYSTPVIYYWLKPVKIFPNSFDGKINYESWWAIEGPVSFDDQTNPNDVSKFAQKHLYAIHLLQKVHSVLPGWEKCYIVRTSDRIGFRQTRILKGLYSLTDLDVKEGHFHPDVIGRGSGHDISRFHPDFEFGYDIPYRALIPAEIDGLLVGARSISCDPNDPTLIALNAHRGISATIICSQAAGVAAAICIQQNLQPRQVNIQLLQEMLRSQDVILNAPKE